MVAPAACLYSDTVCALQHGFFACWFRTSLDEIILYATYLKERDEKQQVSVLSSQVFKVKPTTLSKANLVRFYEDKERRVFIRQIRFQSAYVQHGPYVLVFSVLHKYKSNKIHLQKDKEKSYDF